MFARFNLCQALLLPNRNFCVWSWWAQGETTQAPTLTPALKCYDDISLRCGLQELGLCLFPINHFTGTGGGPLATQPTPGDWPRRWQLPFKFNANKKGVQPAPIPETTGVAQLSAEAAMSSAFTPSQERLEQTHKWPPWPLLSGIIPVSCAAGGAPGGPGVKQG